MELQRRRGGFFCDSFLFLARRLEVKRQNPIFQKIFLNFFVFCSAFFGLVLNTIPTEGQTVNISSAHGQIWKQYDISSYTSRFPNMSRPESVVSDWILMETGFEVWHSEIPAMLNVTHDAVNVYHTPEIQSRVEGVIQRFVNVEPMGHQFRVYVFTVNAPFWRQKLGNMLSPIPSYSMGSQAWTVAPEELKDLVQIFEKTPGYTNHLTEAKLIPNGQRFSTNLIRTRRYTRNFYIQPDSGKSPEPEQVLMDDGFSFELMPLITADGTMVDAQVKLQINHLDRFLSINIVPPGGMSRTSERIEVPMVGQFRFRERYAWSTEKALLISPGLTPPLTSTGEDASFSLLNSTQRVETLILIVYRKVSST